MKIIRGQEANLESSKGSIGAANENLWNPWQSMKLHEIQIYENPWESMKIYETRLKSSEDKKPAWNPAKVSTGAASRNFDVHAPESKFVKILKIYQKKIKSMKSMKIYKKCDNL